MNPKDYEKWKTMRETGKLRYVFFHGVLKIGITMFFFAMMLGRPYENGFLTYSVLFNVVLGLACGLFFGFATWSMNESMFQRLSRTRDGK